MKIIYIANARIPTEKAHGIQIMKMCEAFSRMGHEVKLVIPKRVSHLKDEAFSYYGMSQSFVIVYLPTIDLIRLSWLVPKLFYLIQNYTFVRSVKKFMAGKKVDLVFTRDELVAGMIPESSPMILEIHNISGIIKNKARELNAKAWKIIVITAGLKKELIKLGYDKDKIIILPDGVDLDLFDIQYSKFDIRKQLGLPKDKKIVMYTGNFFEWKGVYVLAEAAKEFDNDFLFIFVGGSPFELENFKRQLTHDRGLVVQDNIKLLGHVPHSEVPKYLVAADVLVLPNSGKTDISKYYTSPLKLFEYMASGKPIVASDLPSIREIVSEEQVEFAQPDNAKSLAEAIKKASGKDFSGNRDFVQKYSWSERAKTIILSL